jgi:uncharacterized protein
MTERGLRLLAATLVAATLAAVIVVAVIPLAACSGRPEPPAMGLQEAAIRGDVAVVEQHIRAHSDLNESAADGSTPLITSAAFGTTEVTRALLKAGVDPNLKKHDGSTALITAAFLCHPDVVQVLLDYKADRGIRNDSGSTALDSVSGPFEQVKTVYDLLQEALGPLGLKLDYEYIKATRPKIVEMLK